MTDETANLIQTLAALFTAGAAIFATYVAWYGLKTWQSQLMEK